MSGRDEWETVATYGATYEAEIAAGRLQSSGIPSRIDQRGGIGVFGPAHEGRTVRGVALLVPKERLEAARAALDIE
jgi:hypothetical protein